MSAAPFRQPVDVRALACRTWDAVVIGAGPAGCATAHGLARRGLGVLLVDRAMFPRAKVCGGCLNGRALACLERAGLQTAARDAAPLHTLRLRSRGRSAGVTLGRTVAVERSVFDARLVRAAVEAGTTFADGLSARVLETGGESTPASVALAAGGDDRAARVAIETRCVITADGLAGSSLGGLREFGPRVSRASRFGVGATLEGDADEGRRLGLERADVLAMAVGPSGYVGACRLADGRIAVGAALDPSFARGAGGPGPAVAAILRHAGGDPPASLVEARWHGTPALTRRRPRVASGRVLVVGDASGYVEPFTGEGMAWALESAEALIPLAALMVAGRAGVAGIGMDWTSEHRRRTRAGHRVCRLIAWGLRRGWAVRAATAMMSAGPTATASVLRGLFDAPGLTAPAGEGGLAT